MNPVHPLNYHLAKAEEAHRLALIERRAMARSGQADNRLTPETPPVQRRMAIPRAVAAAAATVALLLSIVVGSVVANEQSADNGSRGGGSRVLLQ
ncbi:MAG TPA: hypothetical protein VK992_04745 [Candidatus Caenarcaniphilales bacterium]|nr:hypothetical protein [Candidatus Caenarcaniphilales bacterium]